MAVVWAGILFNADVVASMEVDDVTSEAATMIRELTKKAFSADGWITTAGSLFRGHPYRGLRLDVYQRSDNVDSSSIPIWSYACVFKPSINKFKAVHAQCLLEKLALITENFRREEIIHEEQTIGVLDSIISHQMEEASSELCDQSLEYYHSILAENKAIEKDREQEAEEKYKREQRKMEKDRLRAEKESQWMNGITEKSKNCPSKGVNISYQSVWSDEEDASTVSSVPEVLKPTIDDDVKYIPPPLLEANTSTESSDTDEDAVEDHHLSSDDDDDTIVTLENMFADSSCSSSINDEHSSGDSKVEYLEEGEYNTVCPSIVNEYPADSKVDIEEETSSTFVETTEAGDVNDDDLHFKVEMVDGLRVSTDAFFLEDSATSAAWDANDDKRGDNVADDHCFPCRFFHDHKSPVIELN